MKVNFIEAVRIANEHEGKVVATSTDKSGGVLRLRQCPETGGIQTLNITENYIPQIDTNDSAYYLVLPYEVLLEWEILPEFQ